MIAIGLGAAALLLLALAGPASRVGVALPTAFALLRWGAYLGIAAAAVAVVALFVASRRGRRAALVLPGAALLMGLIAVGVPYQWQRRAQGVPPIHDISTDLDNPPAFEKVVALRADAPNDLERTPAVADQQRKGYPDLAPLQLSIPPDQAFDRALALVQERGWEIVTADKSTGRIEATDTTTWFGFKDDVVIRMTPWGAGTRVDVRSVSRVGRSDVGTNARRIQDLLDDLSS